MRNNEKKIVLTPLELKVLKMFLEKKYKPLLASEDEVKALSSVIDKADALMDELHADDELGNSLMVWFWNKYKKQEGIEEELDFNDGNDDDGIRWIFDR